MAMRKISMGAIIAVAVTGLFLTMVTAGLLTANQTVPSGGTITAVNLGVYTDSGCTTNCTSLDWGALAPGNTTNRTVYLKNIGTLPETLTMTTTNWSANANNYLTVTCNQANQVLAVGQSVAAILTLTASANAGNITTFSFNVVLTGTQ